MKFFFNSIFLPVAIGVAISGLHGNESSASCSLKITDCEPFDRLSSKVENSVDDSSSSYERSSEGSYEEYSPATQLMDNTEAIYAEPILYNDSDEEDFADSRLVLMDTKSLNLKEEQKKSFENTVQKQPIETLISELFKTVNHFKTQFPNDPELLNTEYTQLEDAFSILKSQIFEMNSKGYILSEEAAEEVVMLKTLFEMINLNIAIRAQGCGEQLGLEEVQNDGNGISQIPPKSKIKYLIEKLEKFVEAMSHCYDEKDKIKTNDDEFGAVVDHLSIQFDTLESQFKPFLSQETILSKIFKDELNIIEEELAYLLTLVDTQNPYYGETGTNTSAKKKSCISAESQEFETLTDMQKSLEYAHNLQYHDSKHLDFDKYHAWRNGINLALNEVESQLVKKNYSESCEKHNLEALVKIISHEIITKTNSVLLLVTELTTNGQEEDPESLDLFLNFYEIIKADIRYVDFRLSKCLRNLERIEDIIRTLSPEDAKMQIHLQRTILEKTSEHIKLSSWATLPGAEKYKKLELQAFRMLNHVETFLN